MGKFQIKKQTNNHFRFIMRAGNGQIILTSEPYETKDKCLDGIESLRINALDKNRYEFKKSFNLKHYFNVTDAHGEITRSIHKKIRILTFFSIWEASLYIWTIIRRTERLTLYIR